MWLKWTKCARSKFLRLAVLCTCDWLSYTRKLQKTLRGSKAVAKTPWPTNKDDLRISPSACCYTPDQQGAAFHWNPDLLSVAHFNQALRLIWTFGCFFTNAVDSCYTKQFLFEFAFFSIARCFSALFYCNIFNVQFLFPQRLPSNVNKA